MSKALLLDSNVLIALSYPDHLFHQAATDWFSGLSGPFATCPITQASLVRFTVRHFPNDSSVAKSLLQAVTSLPNHEFWPDDLSCDNLPWGQLWGHRQVTDAYLVCLASVHGSKLATFDSALATVFPDAVLIGA